MKATIYIKTETDAALSKLGGANRAENLRRAVALAECADELAEALDNCVSFANNPDGVLLDIDQAQSALTNYRSAKQ